VLLFVDGWDPAGRYTRASSRSMRGPICPHA